MAGFGVIFVGCSEKVSHGVTDRDPQESEEVRYTASLGDVTTSPGNCAHSLEFKRCFVG